MTSLLRLLDALPRWLRWALFLPVGIGCSLIVQGAVHVGFDVAGPAYRTAPGMNESVVTAFAAGVTLAVFPAMLSPKPWPVGVVIFTMGLLLRVSFIAYQVTTTPYVRPRVPVVAVVIAVNTLGGCLGLLLIRHFQRYRDRGEEQRAEGHAS